MLGALSASHPLPCPFPRFVELANEVTRSKPVVPVALAVVGAAIAMAMTATRVTAKFRILATPMRRERDDELAITDNVTSSVHRISTADNPVFTEKLSTIPQPERNSPTGLFLRDHL